MQIKIWWLAALGLLLSVQPVLASQSEHFGINQSIVNSSGNTRTGSGKTLLDSLGEAQTGQSYGKQLSAQAGFFNDYFLPAPTPTVTCTPIRTFGGQIMSEHYVFAAPNPIRGTVGRLFFDIAESAEVTLKIFTVSNQLVLSQHWDSLLPGTNHWDWPCANMANGVYLLWIRAKGTDGKTTTITKKIALIR
jgi:hypothetical protein